MFSHPGDIYHVRLRKIASQTVLSQKFPRGALKNLVYFIFPISLIFLTSALPMLCKLNDCVRFVGLLSLVHNTRLLIIVQRY